MFIKKICIENFKCYKSFELGLNSDLNILVGDNEAGKSTILEAMHLALTGLIGGKHIRNELSQYLFNNAIVTEFLDGFKLGATPLAPPNILIELFFGDGPASFEGDRNSTKSDACGFQFEIKFDDKYQGEYADLLKEVNSNQSRSSFMISHGRRLPEIASH
jgi:putative ATP-dependent endonuclease of OLD family